MPNSNPIFIPFSKLNSGKKCITCSLQNFTGKVHITLDGVLFCSTDYDGFEEDLEQAFDSFGLGVGVPPVSVVADGIINDDEAAAVAAATAAAVADGFDDNEELVVGETLNGGHGNASSDGNGSNDGDESNEDDDTDDDTVTDLPSSKLQFDSDDDSYDEDRHFSQQANFFN